MTMPDLSRFEVPVAVAIYPVALCLIVALCVLIRRRA
jgi:hypothetical protein